LWCDLLEANRDGYLVVIDMVKGAFERLGHVICDLAPASHRSVVLSPKIAHRLKIMQADQGKNPILPQVQPGNPNIWIWRAKKGRYTTIEKELAGTFGMLDVDQLSQNLEHFILIRENENPIKLNGLGPEVTYIVSMYAPYTEAARAEKRDRARYAMTRGWRLIAEGRHASGHTPIVPKTHPLADLTALSRLRNARATIVMPIHGELPETAAKIVERDYIDRKITRVIHRQTHPTFRTVLYDPDKDSSWKTR
jgi:hypothetical protein